jgi:translocation and assembly module TamB
MATTRLFSRPARIATAQGQAELKGRVADQLDLTLSLEDFPAAAANALRPDLGLAGVVSGTLHATGPAEDPILNFDLRGAGIRGEPLRTVPVP